tara:strand:+ start:473 stop:694 length:222 start_codon:yes stop_codon:yes gene_type:complete
MTEHDYDEGYRAGMQKMRDLAQARIDTLEEALGDVTDACGERKGIWKDLNWIDRRDLKEALGKAAAALKGTNK